MKSMSFKKAGRLSLVSLLLVSALALAACGFHLRENAKLPSSMQHVHLSVTGNNDFRRILARALEVSGVEVEDESGTGTAELRMPVAAFSTETLTAGGYVRITEYAVHYQVQFDVIDPSGQTLIPNQRIDMSREYSYDASNTVGNASQVEEIQRSLNDDMAQAILFRLQAASKHDLAVPATASSTH
jgi:LPS-assembly lipoprotein